ncbi:MAG TPA: glycosyltransferase family 4 protein [Bacteroidia bacterium]|jgi:glycosyltransferase involved in cell wall biosynthesis|nr:glycosyltransferase family 4 protein [Bacteroidia bacterium]
MKILQLCNKIPYPEKDGGALGVSVFSNSLVKAGCQVKMLAMNTKKHHIDLNKIPKSFLSLTNLEAVEVDTTVRLSSALAALVQGKSYNISRFNSKAYRQKLIELLTKEKFDIIQLEGLYLTPYIDTIRQLSDAPIILRASNVEWKIWNSLGEKESNFIKKIYIRKLAKQLHKFERSVLNQCDGVITFTKTDLTELKNMGCEASLAHIPFGIDISKYNALLPAKDQKSLFYIGALDWLPNLQGVNWFIDNVWEKISAALPGINLHIAGRNMPNEMKKRLVKGITFHGEVDEVFTYIQQYNLMIVPLLAGSGIRVKIIEGMALGRPIITTLVGIEGIECNYGSDVLVENTADEFAKAIRKCIEDSAFTNQLAENGRKFAIEHHDIDKITQNLIQFYKERIKQTGK